MSVTDRPYLSIGEVLGLLLEEFPDITISKIRFLESQGLIDPERTPSGYRKFYDVDVERLRVILREQRENFLPLKVIRRRLENGQIDDPSGSLTPPRGARRETGDASAATERPVLAGAEASPVTPATPDPSAEVRRVPVPGPAEPPAAEDDTTPLHPVPEPAPRDPTPVAQMAPLEVVDSAALSAPELCARAGLTTDQLAQLESYGVIAPRQRGGSYQPGELDVARLAASFLRHGIEARHLRGWRQAVDREAGLFEQLVMPFLRQRNPASRRHAVTMLEELAQLGGELRAALLHTALQHHLDA